MKNCGFRAFIGRGYEPALNVYIEAEGDRTSSRQMPLPSFLVNVISSVPSAGVRANYAKTLEWIFNRGLYAAAVRRKNLAKEASRTPVDLGNGQSGTLGQKIAMLAQQLGQLPRSKVKDPNTGEEYYPVYEHEMFSKEAHQFFAQHHVPELKEFYDKTYGANPYDYEPESIEFDTGAAMGGSVSRDSTAARRQSGLDISLKKLNDYFESNNMPPFRFGGYDGLIEYMEDGAWAPVRSPESPTEFQHGARNGLDLSNPKRYTDDRKEGGYVFYKFADFNPPKNMVTYNKTVNGIFRHTINLLTKKNQTEGLSPEEQEQLINLQRADADPHSYSGDTFQTAHIWDDPEDTSRSAFHVRNSKDHDYSNNPDLYAALKFLILMGLDEYEETSNDPTKKPLIKGTPLNLDTVKSDIFKGYSGIASKYKKSGDMKTGSESYTYVLINIGANRLRRLTNNGQNMDDVKDLVRGKIQSGELGDPETIDEDGVFKEIDTAISHIETRKLSVPAVPSDYDYTKVVPYHQNTVETTPESIRQKFDDGFKLVRTPEERKNNVSNTTIPDRDRFDISFADKLYSVKKDREGRFWISDISAAKNQLQPLSGKMKSTPRPLLAGGSNMTVNSHEREMTPLPKHARNSVLDKIEQDPKKYGYGYKEIPGLKKYSSINDSAAKAAYEIRNKAKLYRIPDNIINSYEDGDLKALALQGLMRHARSYQFRYGNIDSRHLTNYLSAMGIVDPQEQQQAIQFMKDKQNKKTSFKDIDQALLNSDGIKNGPEVKAAFEINGKYWRQHKMIDHAVTAIRQEQGKERGAGKGDENAEGDEIQNTRMDAAGGNRQAQFNTSSNKSANIKRDVLTGDYISDDINELPDNNSDDRDVIKNAGLLQNKIAPFKSKVANTDYYNGYNSTQMASNSLDARHLTQMLQTKLAQMIKHKKNEGPYFDGVKDAALDAIHNKIYDYIKNGSPGGQSPDMLRMFLHDGGRYFIGQDHPVEVAQMLNDLGNPEAEQPSDEPAESKPSVHIVNPNNGMAANVDDPENIRVMYRNAIQYNGNPAFASAIKSAVVSAYESHPDKYKEFLRAITITDNPQPDAAQHQAVPQTKSRRWGKGYSVLGTPSQEPTTATPSVQAAPQAAPTPSPASQSVVPTPTASPQGTLRTRMKAVLPHQFPGPNGPGKMESITSFRNKKRRTSLMEVCSSKS